MELDQLMAGFASRIGIAEPMRNAENAYALSFDGMEVVFSAEPDGAVLMLGAFAAKPAEGTDSLAEVFLSMNHLFAGTGGGTISLDVESGRYCLQRREGVDHLDIEGFLSLVEGFVNKLEQLAALVKDFRPAVDRAADAASKEKAELSGFGAAGFLQV